MKDVTIYADILLSAKKNYFVSQLRLNFEQEIQP